MKKILWQLFSFLGIILLLNSCSRTEPDLFDKSAAERLNESVGNIVELLCSAENGWVFNYFPNGDTEGYTYLMKFTPYYKVTMAAINKHVSKYTESESDWDVIGDMGPVLTFNTYNDIFHLFADPQNDGVGLNGDYEFMVLNKTNDVIILKGKKHAAITIARRLDVEKDWKGYFADLDAMNNLMFNKNVPQLLLSANDSHYTLDNGISHIFEAVPQGGDPIADREEIPFIVTDKGILLSKTFQFGNSNIREFYLSEDKTELLCVDKGENAKITALDPVDLFFSFINNRKNQAFVNSNDNMCEFVKNAYIAVNNGVVAKTRKLDYIQFTKNRDGEPVLAIRTSKTGGNPIEGYFSFIITKKNALELDLSFSGFTGTNKYDQESYTFGKTYYDTYAGIPDFMEKIGGSYTLSIQGNPLISPRLRFVETTDPSKWFDLVLK